MFATNYYCLVAGLREYALDSENKGFDAGEIIGEVIEQLSKKDLGYLRMFYTYYDIENIIKLRSGRGNLSALGNLSKEELESRVGLPKYVCDVLSAYNDPEDTDYDDIDTSERLERSLFGAYYKECAKSKCKFIKTWSEFDRNLRNLAAAYSAREKGVVVADVLVGDGDIVRTLSRSSAADFGLKGELEYIDHVMSAVADNSNLLEKERRIDMVRWEMADELVTSDYFNINGILAYLAKIGLVYRWSMLDSQKGREVFGQLIDMLSGKDKLVKAEENAN